jgi:hypothetical protein
MEPEGSAFAAAPPAGAPIDRLAALVLRDASLCRELCEAAAGDGFVAAVLGVAGRYGIGLSAEAVTAAMQQASLGLHRAFGLYRGPGPAAFGHRIAETALPSAGWLPIRACWQDAQLYLDWCYFGARSLSEPFFEDSVRSRLAEPFNRLFRGWTRISRLAEWLERNPGLQPSGFIFHMSRCGSTLATQMLAALLHTVVVSEASPIDTVVQARHTSAQLGADQQAAWLQWIAAALGQRRGDERHLVIKLDSWHTLEWRLFRQAFPSVPWVFLYRDPASVLASQLKMPGAQMVPGMLGAEVFGLGVSPGEYQPVEYYAEILARICQPVARHYAQGAGLLVNYRQLPEALWTAIMPHFGITCSDRDRARIAEVAQYDAKTPGLQWTADSAAKRAPTETISRVAERRVGEVYRRLEALRLAT